MVLVSHAKPEPKPHEKKRHGHHHQKTKHYHKTYWPYLPLLTITIVGLAISSWWPHGSRVLGVSTSISSAALLQQTNIARTTDHKTALALNNELTKAAEDKAQDMVARNYWSHNTPDGEQPWAFVKAVGYSYFSVGENLAYGFGSSEAAVNGWLNSPAHRENLLNSDYSDVGFGIADSPNYQGEGAQTVIVAFYGKPDTTGLALRNGDQAEVSARVAAATTAGVVLPAKNVSRLETLSGRNLSVVAIVIGSFGAAALVVVLLRHGRIWRRFIVHGEEFVIKYHMLDVVLVAGGIGAYILTRSAGVIH